MTTTKRKRTDPPRARGATSSTLQVSIPVKVTRDRFSLRQTIATAKGDGFEVEVSSTFTGGAVEIQIRRPGVPGWLAFELDARVLIEMALEQEGEARAALDLAAKHETEETTT